MNQKVLTSRFTAIVTIILFGAFMRFLPHWPNVTPIAAMALFGGAYLNRKTLAFAIPFGAMLLSDAFFGFYSYMWTVYLGFGITVLIGMMLKNRINFKNVTLAAVGSSVVFFLLTNFGSWLWDPIYPKNFIGLMESYTAGLVFFNDGKYGLSFFLNDVVGTLFFSGLFFGAFALAEKKVPAVAASN